MSDGLDYLASILDTESAHELRRTDRALFLDDEIPVYDFVRTHYRNYGELPRRETVRSNTRTSLPEVDERLEYYRQRVSDRKLYNDVRDYFPNIREAMQQNNMEEVVRAIEHLHRLTRTETSVDDVRQINQTVATALREYRTRQQNPGLTGIPTGWRGFDAITGGYQDADLVAWVARMGMGKTYLLLKQAIAAWETRHRVMFVSMEMSLSQITNRFLGMQANVNPNFIKAGALSSRAYQRIARYVEGMASVENMIFVAGSFKKKTTEIEMLAQEIQPDAIYLDGAYLLKPEDAGRAQRYERIAQVFDDLAAIRVRLGTPLVFTTQFSKQAGKRGKEGSLESIAFSDAVAMHCSLVVGIKEGRNPYQKTRRRIEFMKGREGEQGEKTVNYNFTPMDFTEVDEETLRAERPNMDWMA
jgi:replicative DNA helicase